MVPAQSARKYTADIRRYLLERRHERSLGRNEGAPASDGYYRFVLDRAGVLQEGTSEGGFCTQVLNAA